MFFDWEWVTLDKLGKIIGGKGIPYGKENLFSLFYKGSIPLISGQEVSQSRLYIKNFSRLFNQKGLKTNKLLPKDSVCLVCIGSSGCSGILTVDSCLTNAVYSFIPEKNISDSKFMKYCFDFSRISSRIKAFASLSTVQSWLNLHEISLITFPKPPLEIQQKIGNILANYDLILDNHEKQIEILKKLKISLFKEWFIKLRFPSGYESYGARGGGYLKVE